MATPTPNDPKKPTPPGQKPGASGNGPQPPTGNASGAGKSGPPPAKPPASKPAGAAGDKPPGKKPGPAKNKFAHIDSNTRQLGQKLVDLGFLDDAMLESVYEDMRTSES